MLHFVIKKERAYFLALLLGSFVCPILVIPLALHALYHKKLSAFYPLSLSLAVIFCVVPITDDAYNYYRVFMHYQNMPLAEVFYEKDFLFYLLSYCCHHLGCSYFVLRFILVASSSCMLAWIFNNTCRNFPSILENRHYFFLSTILFILSIDFVSITNAMRYGTATVFAAVSFVLWCQNKFGKSIFFYFLAIEMHFGSWLYLPPFLVLLTLKRYNISLEIRIALLIMAFLCGELLFMYFYSFLPSSLQISTYIDGYWANLNEYRNFHGRMYALLHHQLIFAFLLLFFLLKKKVSFNLEKLTFGILLTYVAFFSLPAIGGRIFTILKLFIILSLIIHGSQQTSCMRFIRLWFLIGLMAFSQSLDIYRFREALFVLDNVKFWIFPISYLFDDYYTTRAYLFQNRSM